MRNSLRRDYIEFCEKIKAVEAIERRRNLNPDIECFFYNFLISLNKTYPKGSNPRCI